MRVIFIAFFLLIIDYTASIESSTAAMEELHQELKTLKKDLRTIRAVICFESNSSMQFQQLETLALQQKNCKTSAVEIPQ